VTQRTARQWAINIVLTIVTVSFMGLSLAPLVSQILAPKTPAEPAESPETAAQKKRQSEIDGYEAVLRSEPNNQFALRQLVDLRLEARDVAGAIAPLTRLAELNPKETRYRLELAGAHLFLKNQEAAAKELRQVLAIEPGNLRALENLVQIELGYSRPESAIGVLEDALAAADTANQVQPDSVDRTSISLLLADLYAFLQRFDEALALYEQVTKADAQDFRPVLGQAQVRQAQGLTAEADTLFNRALELTPARFKDEVQQRIETARKPLETPAPTPPQP
jgi:tetratricopeptide (TPR) repeat protein